MSAFDPKRTWAVPLVVCSSARSGENADRFIDDCQCARRTGLNCQSLNGRPRVASGHTVDHLDGLFFFTIRSNSSGETKACPIALPIGGIRRLPVIERRMSRTIIVETKSSRSGHKKTITRSLEQETRPRHNERSGTQTTGGATDSQSKQSSLISETFRPKAFK